MNDTIYRVPESDLVIRRDLDIEPLTAAEKLAQTRKDMEEVGARTRLNFVWGSRLAADILILLAGLSFVVAFWINPSGGFYGQVIATLVVCLLLMIFVGLEIFFIIAYFSRRPWCKVPLHIFSVISLLNFPFGTILSVIHFFSMGKIQFKKVELN